MLRILLLAAIRLYWWLVPEERRRSCLFRLSCSRHVHAVTAGHGFVAGLRALRQRWRRCRPGYDVRWDSNREQWGVRFVDGTVAWQDALSDGLVEPYEATRRASDDGLVAAVVPTSQPATTSARPCHGGSTDGVRSPRQEFPA